MSISEQWNDVFTSNYGSPRLLLTEGKGLHVKDSNGREFRDFLGGIATNIVGHAHPKVIKAVEDQIRTLSHVSNLYAHPQVLELAKKLQALVGDESARIFFCNSGAEANEAAIKASRLTGKSRIVAFTNSFHGRTIGALSITGQPGKAAPFEPLLPGVKFLKYGDFKSLKKGITKRTAMVMIEPIQGEAGVLTLPKGFLTAVRERCTEVGALLGIDEVQTGMGRTGKWFGYQHEEIKPDIITLAKGLGGGLPLGAMIALGESAKLFTPGTHGSTFGGNPISVAASRAAISVIEEDHLLPKITSFGELIINTAQTFPKVKEVRGAGLLIGIEFIEPIGAEILAALEDRGFLVNSPNPTTIRISPPLIAAETDINDFLVALRSILVGRL